MELSVKQYMQQQPGYPNVSDTDKYYYVVAVHVARAWDKCGVLVNIDERARVRVVLALIGYYQDIVADAGLWRTFTSLHEAQYGQPLPHYGRAEEYVDYELNLDDLRYLIWYTLDYSPEVTDALDPHDGSLLQLAREVFAVLDYDYEHAPVPVELTMLTGVDLDDENDRQATYDLAHWFYWRSYLMQGNAHAATTEAMPQAHDIIARCGESDAAPLLHDLNDRIMATRPATMGPISLPLAQWLKEITK
ncbi:MAG: DUF3843 family protein [Muribaculaceae bacterium]|nr:DUF3843 family protein [Muribaculaceae bacterium]